MGCTMSVQSSLCGFSFHRTTNLQEIIIGQTFVYWHYLIRISTIILATIEKCSSLFQLHISVRQNCFVHSNKTTYYNRLKATQTQESSCLLVILTLKISKGAGEVAKWLTVLTAFAEGRVRFPVPTSGGLQLPLIPCQGFQCPLASACEHKLTQVYIHTYKFKTQLQKYVKQCQSPTSNTPSFFGK